jgi:hypothetical protein
VSDLPIHVSAVFGMLAQPDQAVELPESEWSALLEFADRTQLTLHLRGVSGPPSWMRREVDLRLAKNARRRERLRSEYLEVARTLQAAGIEFVVLKGVTHEAGFGIPGTQRVQYDIDLLCPLAEEARRALGGAGYVPHGDESLSDEHGRPMVRPPGHSMEWQWRGDYFDPEMPIPVEVHATPWNAKRDRIKVEGLEEFWKRRCVLGDEELGAPAYSQPDRLAFAALHALRHILRNDARPAHVYELARFLEIRRLDVEFWKQWKALHPAELQRLQAVAFRFAQTWFGVTLPDAVAESVAGLPRGVEDWLARFSWSPVVNLMHPNKEVVWLHAALVRRWRDRLAVLRERLMPARLPHHGEATPYPQHLLSRARYHATGSALALASGFRWWWQRTARSSAEHTSD